MAGNEWINGYLEAILDSGAGGSIEDKPTTADLRDSGHFNPTKYFVEEVVTGVDETDLHRTWIKVVATRNTRERSSRLENMCWRIWHLTRKKKQLTGVSFYTTCLMTSLHGLVRGENMELGRDSDTGGQVKYVVELARALAKMPGVYRVDLFTRQVLCPDVDWSYGEPTEMLSSGAEDGDGNEMGESSGAYIVRIPFGPRDKYLRKELLWPYIQEFVDGALVHILNMSKVLGEQIGEGKPIWPYVIHGHYADAGDSAALLSGALNVPMVLTGHSLGRNKLEQLLKQGRQSKEDINSTYKIMRRIEGEELALDAAELVITSTKQEIEEQWGLYDGFDVKLEKVLRARSRRGVNCHGRYMPRMVVIPPGMDFSNVVIQEDTPEVDGELTSLIGGTEGSSPKAIPTVMRFLTNPHKPMILALSRPDPKKNITTLLKAFGECRPLRELANLTLIMGNRDDIDEMTGGNANVLTTVLKMIDKYDLYGLVAYPKHHKQADVPEIYRLAAKTKGVFINPALVEPFGLTLIEAAAHGLPMVATKNGGPVDINRALNNGLLVDPHDQYAIADALLKLVSEKNLWHDCRRNGWKNIHLFSWPEHCRTYLTRVAACRMRHPQWQTDTPFEECPAEQSSLNDSLKDVQDMSLRLSIDGFSSSVDYLAASGERDIQDQVKNVMSRMKKPESTSSNDNEPVKPETGLSKYPLLRKRRRLIVIALDCYDNKGEPEGKMVKILQDIMKAIRMDSLFARVSGIAISTAMSLSETQAFLKSAKLQTAEFDALICSSGSELYYPGAYAEGDGKLYPDPDYATHIDYRWGCEGLKNTIWKLMNSPDQNGGPSKAGSSSPIEKDDKLNNTHCITYLIKDPSRVMKVQDLRQKLRMRGLRCHPMYCRASTRMQIIPLLASRAQALRYLFVRWRLNVGNMFVILGETGDTDYQEMISGAHKTIVMKNVVKKGSEELMRSEIRDDMVPKDSPLVAFINGEATPDEIASALKQVSKTSAGM
ncbi:unnamed protein product [Linum tenue]|uniref:Sucrose-phosphate synthase n=1 Tax=Linum tenue TaxID=586396 RepID=A0AAV0LRD6_9ROSI|nr:unnamed protein product [Linum tenue]